jgi:hypothetical protein
VTVQVPAPVADKVPPEIEHPELPAASKAYVTAPPSDPPLATSRSGAPKTPDVDVIVSAACEALEMEIVVDGEETAL